MLEPALVTALLGPSGSGKTTVLKMIAGVLSPTSGDVRFDGASVLGVPAHKRDAVMVFHNALLFSYLTAAENVAFGLRMRKVPPAERTRKVGEMLDLVGLSGLDARYPDELSGGQQQRVALARALVVEPKLLLLDEPLANLDPGLRDEMRELLVSVQRSLGLTALLVTHDQEDAIVAADHIALIRDGTLVQEGGVRDFFERPATAWVAGFFGAANLIPGDLAQDKADTALGPMRVGTGGPSSGPVLITIRPEAVLLDAADTGENSFDAVVTAVDFRGTHVVVRLAAGDVDLESFVAVDDAAGRAIGDVVRVTLPPGKLWPVPVPG